MARQQPIRGKGGLSNVEKLAKRADAIVKIKLLLANGRQMPVREIAYRLGLNVGTTYGYLKHMAGMGEARHVGLKKEQRSIWALGQEERDEDQEAHAPRHGAVIVPAQQIGMFRHWMDVALFGPAAKNEGILS